MVLSIAHLSNSAPISPAQILTAMVLLHIYRRRGTANKKTKKQKEISYMLSRGETIMQEWCQHVCKSVCPRQSFNLKRFLTLIFKTFNYSCSCSIFKPIFIISNSISKPFLLSFQNLQPFKFISFKIHVLLKSIFQINIDTHTHKLTLKTHFLS